MIPTESKAKLPKHLSYPLGAEVVSQALAGVPQYEQLKLFFRDRPGTSAMQFQVILREGTPYVVLEVAFNKWSMGVSTSQSMVDTGWYDKRWEIKVCPVLRQHRHAARVALLRDALPAVKQWLSQPGATSWASGHRRLEFVFDPNGAVLTPKESGEVLA